MAAKSNKEFLEFIQEQTQFTLPVQDNFPEDAIISEKSFESRTDILKYRNDLLQNFGLNESNIAIKSANNIHGNIFRKLLIDREAYMRALEKYIIPTQSFSATDLKELNLKKQIQDEYNQKKADELKQYNFEKNYSDAQKSFFREQIELLGYKEFMIQLYLAARAIWMEKRMQIAINELVRILSEEQAEIAQQRAEDSIAIRDDYISQIKEIESAIQTTEKQLAQVRAYKVEVQNAIDIQTEIIEDLIEQIEECDELLEEIEDSIEEKLALKEQLEHQIFTKEELKQEVERDLDHLRTEKKQIEDKRQEIEDEISEHESIHELKETELQKLYDKFRSEEDPEERAKLNKDMYQLEQDTFLTDAAAFFLRNQIEEEGFDEKYKAICNDEVCMVGHIEELKHEIANLKQRLKNTTDELDILEKQKELIRDKRAQLSEQLEISQATLAALQQEMQKVEEREATLIANLKSYNELKQLVEDELKIKEEILVLNKEQTALETEFEENNFQLQKATSAVAGLSKALENTENRIQAKQQEIDKLEPGSPKRAKMEKALEKMKTSQADLQEKFNTQNEKLEQYKSLTSTQEQRLDEIKTRLKKLTADLAENTSNKQNLKAKIHEMESQGQAIERGFDPILVKMVQKPKPVAQKSRLEEGTKPPIPKEPEPKPQKQKPDPSDILNQPKTPALTTLKDAEQAKQPIKPASHRRKKSL